MSYLYLSAILLLQVCLIVQLYFTSVIHSKLRKYKPSENFDDPIHPISVIICARNEEENLKKNLPYILQQDYSDFEVIVVNDCSVDDSEMLLRELSQKFAKLKVVTIREHERFKHGKKFAATLGIKASANEHLLFTDADCRPASVNWLNLMQRNFGNGTEIVLGYSPYKKHKGFINMLVRFETFFTALNYLSFSLAGNPYMGVGRNLAYKKSLFFKGKGFASHMHIASGDDDLFVNQNANPENTVIEIHADSYIWSEPKETLDSYVKQKLRHIGAGAAYRRIHKQMLTVQAGTAILFYICIICLIFLKAQWWLLTAFFLIKIGIQLLVYWPIFTKLRCADLGWWYPIFDFIYYFYMLSINILSLFKKNIKWK